MTVFFFLFLWGSLLLKIPGLQALERLGRLVIFFWTVWCVEFGCNR